MGHVYFLLLTEYQIGPQGGEGVLRMQGVDSVLWPFDSVTGALPSPVNPGRARPCPAPVPPEKTWQ